MTESWYKTAKVGDEVYCRSWGSDLSKATIERETKTLFVLSNDWRVRKDCGRIQGGHAYDLRSVAGMTTDADLTERYRRQRNDALILWASRSFKDFTDEDAQSIADAIRRARNVK